MQDVSADPFHQTSQKSQEQQLNRACESCRLSKVRCLADPGSTSSECQRCSKAGKQCVFAPPAKRRQRKRTDVRVAELEKEIKLMRTLMRPSRISPVEASDESMDEDAEEQEERLERGSSMGETSGSATTSATAAAMATPPRENWPITSTHLRDKPKPFGYQEDSCGPTDTLGQSEMDIIDRGLITKEMAEEFLDIYRNNLVSECPGVVIPHNWTLSKLRCQKPALFHAVMAAAAHCKGAALSNRLHEEAVLLYARSLFIKGEKSLQYVQALLVTVTYYTPPNVPAQLQVYQYGNMAASMALELGLASKPRTHEELPKRAIRSLQRISSPDELLENCRTILVLYTLNSG